MKLSPKLVKSVRAIFFRRSMKKLTNDSEYCVNKKFPGRVKFTCPKDIRQIFVVRREDEQFPL